MSTVANPYRTPLTERLRAHAETLRRKPMALADLIPLLQEAADEIERLEERLDGVDISCGSLKR